MSLDPLVQVAIVTGLASGFGAIASGLTVVVVTILQNKRLDRIQRNVSEVKVAAAEVKVKVDKVELATNGMRSDLVKAAELAGQLKGRDDERARNDTTNGMPGK